MRGISSHSLSVVSKSSHMHNFSIANSAYTKTPGKIYYHSLPSLASWDIIFLPVECRNADLLLLETKDIFNILVYKQNR